MVDNFAVNLLALLALYLLAMDRLVWKHARRLRRRCDRRSLYWQEPGQ